MRNLTDVAAIAGVGETEYVRGTKKSERQLIMEASARAAADAGIRPREIDGLVMAMKRDRPTNEDFVQALGIRDLKFHAHSHIGGASAAAGVTLAAAVVATGMAENVLVATGWTAFSGPVRLGSVSNELATGDPAIPSADIRRNIDAPVGLNVPMQLYSLHANRYFYETGSSGRLREIALTTRRHANLKPNAYMRDRPMSAEDYDSSPMVVDPFHLYDICLETDGAGAVIVSRASNVTRANRHREVVHIGGGAEGHPDTPFDLASRGDITNMGVSKAAPRALDMAGIT
jgi:acetyl-CoA acetyltransferase